METVGSRLKKARQKKGITLEDSQKALKVHPDILRALEENRAHEFLSPVYARSFLRTYAKYLGLEADKLVGEYSGRLKETPEQILHLEPEKERAIGPLNLKVLKKYAPQALKIAAGLVAIVLVLIAGTRTVRFVKTKAVSVFSRMKAAKKISSPAEKKEPAINIPLNKPLVLTVKAKDNVWMEVKSDGEVRFRNILSDGTLEVWKADKKIELWVGNAGALELMLNDIPLGSPGRGVKRGIVITHKGMKLP